MIGGRDDRMGICPPFFLYAKKTIFYHPPSEEKMEELEAPLDVAPEELENKATGNKL